MKTDDVSNGDPAAANPDEVGPQTAGPAAPGTPAPEQPAAFILPPPGKVKDSGVAPDPKILPQRAQVHVAPDLLDLVTGSATPEDAGERKKQRDLNEVVHSVLIIGLGLSTLLMLIGVGLELFTQRELPNTLPRPGEVFHQVVALQPEGFLALGLFVLIATPILRVIGSIGVFLYERDWRYAGITGLVFIVMLVSILLGAG